MESEEKRNPRDVREEGLKGITFCLQKRLP